MEEKKNNKGLIWLIVILIILVLGLVGYVVYDKVLSKDKLVLNNNETTTITTTKQVSISIEKIDIKRYVGNWYINREHAQEQQILRLYI